MHPPVAVNGDGIRERLCWRSWCWCSGSQSTDLQLELKRKRSVVPPPSDTGQAVKDADAAARQLDEQRQADEMRTRAMWPPSPPLDESVVEGSRSRQLQEGPKH